MRWEADVRLAERVRFRIGGPTPRLGHAEGEDDLAGALPELGRAGYRVLGWGANLLVSDGGIPEPVIVLGRGLGDLRIGPDAIEAGAATGMPALVQAARRAGRAGWAFLEAVPGSVGGGLRMNAGSVDTGLWDRVEWADARTPEGDRVRLTAADARPSYRQVDVPEEWVFVRARFRAPAGDRDAVEREHRERRDRKVRTQVYDLPSCGSIWRNPGPPHGPAWKLVDAVGMRGARRGDACVTEKHANFIANLGDAGAADVVWLMRETRRRVLERFGVALRAEIRLWGFPAEVLDAVGAA